MRERPWPDAALVGVRAAPELARPGQYQDCGTKQRLIGEFTYAARSWERERRVIARLEHGPQGPNPRFVVTSLQGDCTELYERLYCARGLHPHQAAQDRRGRPSSAMPVASRSRAPIVAQLRAGVVGNQAPCASTSARGCGL